MCNPRSEVANQQQAGNVDNGGEVGQRQGNSFWGIARDIVVRCVIMYFVVSFFTKMQQPKSPSSSSSSSSSSSPGSPGISHEPSTNLFRNGTLMDLYVFINENPSKVNFDNPGELKWIQKELIFGDWNIGPNQQGFIEFDIDLPLSTRVQNNGTIYLHVYVIKAGHHPNPKDPKYSEFFTIHTSHQLNKYKKRRYSSTHNLLTGQTSASKESIEKVAQNIKEEIISHWHPNLTISVIYDQTPWVQGRVPSPFDQYIKFEPTSGKYFPVIYLNDYWNLQREYQPINTTLKSIPLHLTFQPLSMFKWQLYITQSMKSQWNSILGADMMEESDSSQDSVKEALLETSPILLALTIIVSITHSIFEFLAFKNDIQFWRNRESLEGLSVRSVFFNVFQSVVVFLYVLDNDTNTVVRISIGIGLLIEIWKLPKVTNIQIDYQNKLFNIIPRIKIADKGSYVESSTRQYDTLAFKYLSWAVFPLFVGYAVYSLLYEEHKGWYSWVLGMVYGFLLTFGFISMTPQLFINYKLKSVAHLPWRMLTYKFLNTFIDDIFAFVIKMPTMYRIGCFRDDIIFLIYLYQRWIYRVDLKRVNEFGVSGEVMDKKSNELKDKPMAAIKDKDEDEKEKEKEKENVNKPEESKKDQ